MSQPSGAAGTLGIVGVGLIGGSVGLAARAGGWQVAGLDRPAVLQEAVEIGALDRPATLAEIREADVILLAAPISQSTKLLGELAPTDALVTDAASVKVQLVRAAKKSGLRYVGGHPMAGSQLAGVANASGDLFCGARYFLTPTEETDPEDYRLISGFVRDTLGAHPTAVDPERHDLLMAALSHLPHLMAVALLKVASDISPEALSFAGPSFRELTRVGAANPGLWSDILAENAPAVGEALGAFAGSMAQLGSEISNRDAIEARFQHAREAYEELGGILVESRGHNVELAVQLQNQPGVLARVTTLLGSSSINILDLHMRHSHTERAALVLTLSAREAKTARNLLREADFTAEIQE